MYLPSRLVPVMRIILVRTLMSVSGLVWKLDLVPSTSFWDWFWSVPFLFSAFSETNTHNLVYFLVSVVIRHKDKLVQTAHRHFWTIVFTLVHICSIWEWLKDTSNLCFLCLFRKLGMHHSNCISAVSKHALASMRRFLPCASPITSRNVKLVGSATGAGSSWCSYWV